MSKIICDVCGTAYAETANQCPICGCAKRNDARTIDGNKAEMDGQEQAGYQFVKGGRFSKKNVRKRNKEQQLRQQAVEEEDGEDPRSNTGLVVLLLVLLAAVVAVVIYIAITFFGPGIAPGGNTDPVPNTSSTPTIDTTPSNVTTVPVETTEPAEIPCTGITLLQPEIELDDRGGIAQIIVSLNPGNTTDTVTYVSDHEEVATVDERGVVTAHTEGNANITVSCGEFAVVCHVRVRFATEPTTEPVTEPSTEPSTQPAEKFELNRSDITFNAAGEKWTLYSGSIALNKITWTSDNESVATIKNGEVVAVGPGTTTVHGEYNGVKVSCTIRCRWEGSSEKPTDPKPSEGGTYTISHKDVTIRVGESFTLKLKDANGNAVSVVWTASASGKVTINGNTITGAAKGTVNVSTTVGGVTYTCIVRVK